MQQILKEGVFFDGKYSFLQEILIEHYNVTHVISIPSDQFENTTTKTTCIIFSNPKDKKDTTKKIEFSEILVNKYENDLIEYCSKEKKWLMTHYKGDIMDDAIKTKSIG